MDNAPCHTAHKLEVPDNVVLLFQPPYCPELNPIERVWQYIKRQLKNLWFKSLLDLQNQVTEIIKCLSEDILISLTGWKFLTDALSL